MRIADIKKQNIELKKQNAELKAQLGLKELEIIALERLISEKDKLNKTLSEALLAETNKNADLQRLLEVKNSWWITRWLKW